MSIRELKVELEREAVEKVLVDSCTEKSDLVNLLWEAKGGGCDTCVICFEENIKGIMMPCCGR